MKFALLLIGLLGAWWSLGDENELRAWEANGVQASYFADGRLESEATFQGGLRHGPAAEWYSDGSRASSGRYEHVKREGPWTFWRADGSLDAERSGLYVNGCRVDAAQESADS